MMKKVFWAPLATAILLAACGPNQKTLELQAKAKSTFGKLPAKMPGSEKDTPEMVELGRKLYFDVRLSINDTQSCNSCHLLDNKKGGVDNKTTSTGAKGDIGDRNAPTVLNAGFHLAQFWDGRAKDLVEQAKGPILNPVEMAMPSEKAVVDKLSKIEEYPPLFAKAFPGQKNPLTYQNIAEAIAAFERTLITRDRFDDFMDGNLTALNTEELEGLELFLNTGCIQCHNGALLGGNSYRKTGQINAYENTKDLGRFNVTKNDADKYVFKVPSLRNVALTSPYFHDGQVKTLEEAVTKMAYLQLNVQLEESKARKIAKFLNTLTDKERL